MREVTCYNPVPALSNREMYPTKDGAWVGFEDYLELKNKYDRVLALSSLIMRDLHEYAEWPHSMAVPEYFVELACYQCDIEVTKEQEINLSEYQ